MSELRKAAQQALEALDEATDYTSCTTWSPSMTDECASVAEALRAALAQPDEKICDSNCTWHQHHPDCFMARTEKGPEQLVVDGDDLPTLTKWAPQRKPLTDELIDILARSMVKGNKSVNWLCRVIEAEHGIGGEHE